MSSVDALIISWWNFSLEVARTCLINERTCIFHCFRATAVGWGMGGLPAIFQLKNAIRFDFIAFEISGLQGVFLGVFIGCLTGIAAAAAELRESVSVVIALSMSS